MQIIYNYIPQRKHISTVTYGFADIRYLQNNDSGIIIIIIINILLLPKTSHVSGYKRSFAPNLWSQHMVHLMLFPILNISYFHITTFPNNCAVSSMAAVHMSFMSCFPSMLLRYFMNIT